MDRANGYNRYPANPGRCDRQQLWEYESSPEKSIKASKLERRLSRYLSLPITHYLFPRLTHLDLLY
ncbi:MAG: hypothetical protein VKL59_20565 [Nostocaceae cyanobacterium]|nr:hypothetical protein [Nostocaceae cyanobacterium]